MKNVLRTLALVTLLTAGITACQQKDMRASKQYNFLDSLHMVTMEKEEQAFYASDSIKLLSRIIQSQKKTFSKDTLDRALEDALIPVGMMTRGKVMMRDWMQNFTYNYKDWSKDSVLNYLAAETDKVVAIDQAYDSAFVQVEVFYNRWSALANRVMADSLANMPDTTAVQ